MVRLLPPFNSCYRRWVVFFQSHNGAIAARFSSALIRTLRILSIPQWCDCCQFHKVIKVFGAVLSIPQWCDCCISVRSRNVTPKTLSIPQWCDCCRSLNRPDSRPPTTFNPTMVRLLPVLLGQLWLLDLLFQSHNGAIAAGKCSSLLVPCRLLSIPQWCDCCYEPDSGTKHYSTFNPTMVRLLHSFA
jgi:hypothetical protein